MDKYGLSSGNIRSLLQDKFGNIWIGNYSSGVDFISHTQPMFHTSLYHPKAKKNRKTNRYGDYFRTVKGRIWLGGENEAVAFKNEKTT